MVVLVIIVIMSAVVVVSVQPILRDAKMRAGCRMVASTLNYARSHAVTTNSATRVIFDQGQNVEVDISVDDGSGGKQLTPLTTEAGRRYSLPEGIQVTRVAKPGDAQEENGLEFSRLGQSDEAVIELTDERGQKRYVAVDPITGRCRIRTYEEELQFEAEQAEGLPTKPGAPVSATP